MSKHLQQLNVHTKIASQASDPVVRPLQLKANNALLLLALDIIPTLSGKALIA